MVSANLLNVTTSTFAELIGNGKQFQVPPYQRDYSWEEEQWEDLWIDFVALRDATGPAPVHFMGSIVVEAVSDREFRIIDGQQRLATLSILALAVIKQLTDLADEKEGDEKNKERAQNLRQRFVGEKDPASLIEASKLSLNKNDNGFYQDYLVQLKTPLAPKALKPESNLILWRAFEYFLRRLKEDKILTTNGPALAKFLDETVARKLLFILIKVDDDLNAYTVFETLNARGLELSATDLLKNYLFSLVGKNFPDIDYTERKWASIIETVEQEMFPEFLGYFLMCSTPPVSSSSLFKLIREKVKTPQNVIELLDNLAKYAELFSALGDPTHTYWSERPGCKNYIRELTLFRTRQVYPILFVAFDTFEEDEFERLLKLLVTHSFRHTIIGRRNTNELETVYHYAAKSILEQGVRKTGKVYQSLKSVYVSDDRFFNDFSLISLKTSGQPKKIVKYALAKLESVLEGGRPCDFETDPATIEHILPENPGNDWSENFRPSQVENYLYRLGNLSLLEPALNKKAGAKGFQSKVQLYQESRYRLSETISGEDWTPSHIEARQKSLATLALKVWSTDFE